LIVDERKGRGRRGARFNDRAGGRRGEKTPASRFRNANSRLPSTKKKEKVKSLLSFEKEEGEKETGRDNSTRLSLPLSLQEKKGNQACGFSVKRERGGRAGPAA